MAIAKQAKGAAKKKAQTFVVDCRCERVWQARRVAAG
jgi:hypothetical protein